MANTYINVPKKHILFSWTLKLFSTISIATGSQTLYFFSIVLEEGVRRERERAAIDVRI